MGTSWNYKATNEKYLSGREIILLLIETRAKGGNFVLNVSPDHFGEIPVEQQRILQEIGLFMFFNDEAVYGVRPWLVYGEDEFLFTRKKDTDTVYAFHTGKPLRHGERRTFTIKNVAAGENTEISILGQTGEVLEHNPDMDTVLRFEQDESGLHIDALRCYRPYSSKNWPNPIVFKVKGAKKPGF
jgi:alpha-L-fucosidase